MSAMQFSKWVALGLIKPPKAKPVNVVTEKDRAYRAKRAIYREERRRKFKAAGLNWQGKPYQHAPPSFPPLERKEYMRRWRERKNQTHEERKANG